MAAHTLARVKHTKTTPGPADPPGSPNPPHSPSKADNPAPAASKARKSAQKGTSKVSKATKTFDKDHIALFEIDHAAVAVATGSTKDAMRMRLGRLMKEI
ncbi:uncharacterized protein N7529_009848 [Penicillium soppii]|uniref:uncharacterized protein n=1 Tax=Penicillium soppii TaxID=69789 RepID=UPI0025478CAA|nr:uncharacterized protein N7529_009848 [Penicillium soppii]KAJ5855904.1 hypothetical protein N7529_009848 [Penicillium soppii]